MTSNNLERIHKKFLDSVQINFKKPVKLCVPIRMVDNETKTFLVETDTHDKTVLCRTNYDISQLKSGDIVHLHGYLKINEMNMMFIEVFNLYPDTGKSINDERIGIYDKLHSALKNEKRSKQIQKFSRKNIEYVSNIGLIYFEESENDIGMLKTKFQEQCTGNLYLCRIKNNFSERNVNRALEYFRKYREIDLVCILTTGISLEHVLDLSSKDNVKYLLNRKEYPFLISINSVMHEQNNDVMVPHCCLLSNKVFTNQEQLCDFVKKIQMDFKQKVIENINMANTLLEQYIEAQRKKLFELELCIAETADIRFIEKSNNPFEKVKELVAQKLGKEKMFVMNVENMLMKRLIEHPPLKQLYPKLIEGEMKTNEKQTVRPAGIKPPHSDVRFTPSSEAGLEKDKPNIQEKIEKTTVLENSQGEKMSINIERKNNGDL